MNEQTTPIRRQYLQIKQQHQESIVLFRLGDFYEAFDEDAKLISRDLEIVLTSRSMGKGQRIPMAGIPHHALDTYLAKLINKGHKVAICEQVGDPTPGKGLVKREVVRVVTPGTVLDPNLLEVKANNYLAALVIDGERAGIAYIDISTSEFATTQMGLDAVIADIGRLSPSEIIIPKNADVPNLYIEPTRVDDRWFKLESSRERLMSHFEVASLEGYGCAHLPLALRAAGAIISYLEETQKGAFGQLPKLSTYNTESFMILDASTRRNLELFQSSHLGTSDGSLLSVIDLTKTPMGGRLLRRWLGQPLLDLDELNKRQEAIAWFVTNMARRIEIVNALGRIADLERLINRIKSGIAFPRDLIALYRGLEGLPQIRAAISEESSPMSWLSSELRPCEEVVELIRCAISDDTSGVVGDGGVIRPGFSMELDEIRYASRNAKQFLANLEREERERTEIKSLKVGYNKVFGYYIEVTSPHLSRVPEDYIRKQTLVGAERFITPELKEYESLILNAQERISELEATLFKQVCHQIGGWSSRIRDIALALGRIDVLAALAEVAVRNGYTQPQLTIDMAIQITGGRHPVVEQKLAEGEFVPNDTCLSNNDSQLVILTGPNMAGKSTYLRQVALIVLMAQIGSFVPAQSATIGLVDRIFTRVGLMDDLTTGQSTFMMEMTQTANIVNNATSKSLIILDEIGRGTSTYDGLSIARAVAEYIHNNPRLGAKTLFATHYHELVELASVLPRVANLNVSVVEEGGKVIFLRKVVQGGADRSYGIHVAQLAGLPKSVLYRAQEILEELEGIPRGRSSSRIAGKKNAAQEQLPLFGVKSHVLEDLRNIDVDSLTPLEAITKLYELKQRASECP